jgi:hypothetical protein
MCHQFGSDQLLNTNADCFRPTGLHVPVHLWAARTGHWAGLGNASRRAVSLPELFPDEEHVEHTSRASSCDEVQPASSIHAAGRSAYTARYGGL